jgi:hypothetical protein
MINVQYHIWKLGYVVLGLRRTIDVCLLISAFSFSEFQLLPLHSALRTPHF